MKNFLYKLVFPEANKLYFGRAINSYRYVGRVNDQFLCEKHHNCEVQELLDAGEFCFWLVVKEFSTHAQVIEAEKKWLMKVWKSDRLRDRPSWLLNRQRVSPDNRFPSGDANPNKTKEARERISLQHKGKPKPKNRGARPFHLRQERIDFDLKAVWEEVTEALEQTSSYHWGGADIARRNNVSRRTLAKIAKEIRQGLTFEMKFP